MKEPLDRSFGLIIAHVLPGFVCLAGASRLSHTVASWMPALLALVILEFVLLMTSRDCLRRYYSRTRQLLAIESQSLLELRSFRYFAVPRREASRDSYSATNSGSVVFRTRQNWRI
jgi:hypothetical protein